MEFETPNLSAADDQELRVAARAFATLARICDAMLEARSLRRTGYIVAANDYENRCEKLIDSLPEWARW